MMDTPRVISPDAFAAKLYQKLDAESLNGFDFDFVTGPGRSGAVAAVYASHYLGIPFAPFKRMMGKRVLIVDTAALTGRTVRKASKAYGGAPYVVAYQQPPRVKFWYELPSILRGKGMEYIKHLEATQ